jgi:hypothetical protein
MDADRYLRWLLWPVAIGLVAVAAFNFAVDPLQFYRPATAYPPQYNSNQRYQNPGLARLHDYDTIVLGTSHMENASPSMLKRTLGARAVKLAISGSVIREQHLIATLALERGNVRRVIWGIDYGSFTITGRVATELGPFPMHLYRGPLAAAPPYLLSWDTARSAWAALHADTAVDLDTLNTWPPYEYSPHRVEAAWDFMTARWTPALRERWAAVVAPWPSMRDALHAEVGSLLQAYPDTRFDLLLPPYSLFEYANDFRVDDERFFQRILLAHELSMLAQAHPNARVWDFSGEHDITHDLSNYKDLAHFRPEVLEQLLIRLRGEPVVLDPRRIAFQLRDDFASRCASAAAERERFCPPIVACGLQRVSAWIDSGAAFETALTYAHRRCVE